jgi:hypothetical protein
VDIAWNEALRIATRGRRRVPSRRRQQGWRRRPAAVPAGPDPLTTMTGLVLAQDGATPAAGAQVVVDAGPYGLFVTVTGEDGRFSVPGVPTLEGTVGVAASLRDACVLYNTGQSAPVPALVAGGVSDAGTLVLAPDHGPGFFF